MRRCPAVRKMAPTVAMLAIVAGAVPVLFSPAPACAAPPATIRATTPPTSGKNLTRAGASSAASTPLRVAPATRFSVAGAGVIRPGVSVTYYPSLFYAPLFTHPVPNIDFPKPLGHQIISTGPNSYVYRPVTDLAGLAAQGLAALRCGDYQQALVDLDPVLSETPEAGDAWMIRAQALFALADYGKAAQALQTAMRLLPQEQWGRPVVKSAEFFASTEEYTARLQALERFVATHPGEAAGHYLLGYHYGYLGRTDKAARELQAALRLATGSDDLANVLVEPIGPGEVDDERPRPGLPREDERLPPPRRPREF